MQKLLQRVTLPNCHAKRPHCGALRFPMQAFYLAVLFFYLLLIAMEMVDQAPEKDHVRVLYAGLPGPPAPEALYGFLNKLNLSEPTIVFFDVFK